jgi:hypothetical protein
MSNYYGFIYRTVFSDGRYYIGQHKITNQKTLDPMYFGSGVVIKDYIKSKGTADLIREIIEFGNSHDDLNLLEIKYITQEVLNDPLNINLDSGGKHIFSRVDNVKEKIGKTISKMRQMNPEKWPSRKGEKNNKSVNWRLISPEGEEFNICGDLNSFCEIKGISANTIKKAVREGWIPRRGLCAGWLAFNLDLNIGTTRDTLNHGKAISGINNPNYKNRNDKQVCGLSMRKNKNEN